MVTITPLSDFSLEPLPTIVIDEKQGCNTPAIAGWERDFQKLDYEVTETSN